MQQPAIAPEDSECLLRTIEGAAQVRRRYQFFLWLQGDMQRLLPHKLAVCGAWDRNQREIVFEPLHSVPVGGDVLASLTDARLGLTQPLVMAWLDARQQPALVDLALLARQDRAAQGLLDAGYARLLVHGVSRPGRPTELETFFVFGAPGEELGERAAHALGVLLPYLHATWLRVHSQEREMRGAGTAAPLAPLPGGSGRGVTITEREREILRWVREGMSNQEIGEALSISALTVKNHVQKILRKLGAANRAQAVAKAMSMNLFASGIGASPAPAGRPVSDSRSPAL